MRQLVSKEPWWSRPPKPGETEQHLEWGYLLFYDDRSCEFVKEQPSDEELEVRSSCFISKEDSRETEESAQPGGQGKRQKHQGFSIIQMVLAIGLMSFLTVQLIPYVSAWQERKLIQATKHVVEQIAQAAVAFRAERDEFSTNRSWPLDLAILVGDGYLPAPATRYTNSFGDPINMAAAAPPGMWLEISTEMQTVRQARLLAGSWGSIATINGERVTLIIVVPGQESSHSQVVNLDGSHDSQQQVMRGPLHWTTNPLMGFDTGGNLITTSVAMDLGNNDIENVEDQDVQGVLRVENVLGEALLEADIANVQALTATTFGYD